MAAAPEMRASDGDRDRVAGELREHAAQGRLTMEEFSERLELVYQSRTYGELQRITSDLPSTDLAATPAKAEAPARAGRDDAVRKGLKAAWGSWAMVVAICTVIYLMTSPGDYFWPMWVGGPWGVILLIGSIFGFDMSHHPPNKEQ
ncbi:DUF1707 domain-containing protein [Sphaerisporangium rubeum]|uniref:DUF1707 domain-containing protein n=1 Tax=Sphaerisporangium rubeum TaxID=321317 RepID=A0A7X0M6B8_9ACTN|nr:DUF1707 domain-containing protein [Sphaerisporangium rubeum]MBB6471829.1 hypothetical protein [Sphaerisporangium rubeum]